MTRRRFWSIPVVALGLLALAPAPAALSSHGASDLLPDLETQRPKDIEIVTARVGNRTERRLRFDNEVANIGTGPLELYPESRDCDGDGDVRNDRMAVQRIYRDNPNDHNTAGYFWRGVDTDARVRDAGCMDFHAAHRHWHFEDFASYQLKPIRTDGSLGAAMASSTKVSFCIIDVNHPYPGADSPPNKYYTQCDRNSTLGVSVGWSDEYHSTLPDQYVVLPPAVGDGAYCLVSTADPLGKLAEVSTSNNTAGATITISGGGTRVVERDPTQGCG